ncbi:19133_t:CDS:2 [Dentiscutata erythropus]|uniref:19133_t:CDS:1 n=1 Tax=Dentiscutata erythropus TaxID=1348616 RepID=A0A9N9I673_9GLOM|nr:19133_t:CDS:2 [Dentiscutata erythropus]
MLICLAAIAREHKMRNLDDPTKGGSVRLIVEGSKRVATRVGSEASWPRDPLPVVVIRCYIECLSLGISIFVSQLAM